MGIRQRFDKEGVSPVIGIILVVAVTVALVALAATLVFDLGGDVSETPDATVDVDNTPEGATVTLVRDENTDKIYVKGPGMDGTTVISEPGESITVEGDGDYQIIGVIGDHEEVIHAFTVTDSVVTSEVEHDFSGGTLSFSMIEITNNSDMPKTYALFVPQSDINQTDTNDVTIEGCNEGCTVNDDNTVTLDPGYTGQVETSYSTDDDHETVGIIGTPGTSLDDPTYTNSDDSTVSYSGDGSSSGWSGTSSYSSVEYVTVGDEPAEPDTGLSQNISLSTNRLVSGDIEINTYLENTKSTDEKVGLQAWLIGPDGQMVETNISNPNGSYPIDTEYTVHANSSRGVTETVTIGENMPPGTYDMVVTLSVTDKIYTAGPIEVLPDPEFNLHSATLLDDGAGSNESVDDGTRTIQYTISNTGDTDAPDGLKLFKNGEPATNLSPSVKGDGTQYTFEKQVSQPSTFTVYHVGLEESGQVYEAGALGTYEGGFKFDITTPNQDAISLESNQPQFDINVTESYLADSNGTITPTEIENNIDNVTWKINGEVQAVKDVGNGDARTYTHTFNEAGIYDMEVIVETTFDQSGLESDVSSTSTRYDRIFVTYKDNAPWMEADGEIHLEGS